MKTEPEKEAAKIAADKVAAVEFVMWEVILSGGDRPATRPTTPFPASLAGREGGEGGTRG